MDNLVSFILHHWALSLAFVVVVIAIFVDEYRSKVGGSTGLLPSQLVTKINRETAAVLDIRQADAFRKGHIINAINIPGKDLMANLKKLEKYRNKPLVLVCQSGMEAVKKAALLKKQGFDELYILKGGMDAWKKEGLPLNT